MSVYVLMCNVRGGGGNLIFFPANCTEISTTCKKRKRQEKYDIRKIMCMWEWKRERKTLKKLKVEPNVSLTFGGLKGKRKNIRYGKLPRGVCGKIKGIEKGRQGSLGVRECLEKGGKEK